MQAELLDLLCAPRTLVPLRLEGDVLVEEGGSHRYPLRQGIPCLISEHLQIQSRLWQTFYDRAAFAYDATLRLAHWLQLGNEERIRTEFLSHLQVSPGSLIVDIGCGSGSNRAAFPIDATYLGVDLSFNMLRRAQAKCASHAWPAHFVQGDAEALPVRNQRADMILAMGVLQHLGHPGQALREITRVAKQKARVVLIDEKRSLYTLQRKLGWTAENGNAARQLAKFATWCNSQLNLETAEQEFFGEYFIMNLYCVN
jgi:ubiquinone/menaquinone biosynthesis C-methylase UbiE